MILASHSGPFKGKCHLRKPGDRMPRGRAITSPFATRRVTKCGKEAKFGPFSPIVLGLKMILGEKQFNKLRGKGISLHSQVIKDFGLRVGAEGKQVQGLIRLAKKNGDLLGFLS